MILSWLTIGSVRQILVFLSCHNICSRCHGSDGSGPIGIFSRLSRGRCAFPPSASPTMTASLVSASNRSSSPAVKRISGEHVTAIRMENMMQEVILKFTFYNMINNTLKREKSADRTITCRALKSYSTQQKNRKPFIKWGYRGFL